MRNKRIMLKSKILLAILCISICFLKTTNIYADNELNIESPYALLMDMDSKEIIYEKNSQEKIYPASTTKIWTAHLVLKYATNINHKVTVSKDLSNIEPSSMYLKMGESFTVRELLEVLMVKSANDVAVLLAEYVSGSVEEFAKLMNDEALKIGCKNTNFNNPNGLPDENHYTTTYDMALMSIEAMKNPTLQEIVKTKNIKIEPTEYYPKQRVYVNSNKFISGKYNYEYKGEVIDSKYDIINGLKTGYTKVAGNCLVATAQKDNMNLLSAIFKSDRNMLYRDSRTLIDYGYETYKTEKLIDKDEIVVNEKVMFGKNNLLGEISEDFYITINKKDSVKNYDIEIELDEELKLPISEKQKIGIIRITNEKDLIDTIDVYAKESVESIFKPILQNYKIIIIIFVLLCILIAIYYNKNKRYKRKVKITRIKYRVK